MSYYNGRAATVKIMSNYKYIILEVVSSLRSYCTQRAQFGEQDTRFLAYLTDLSDSIVCVARWVEIEYRQRCVHKLRASIDLYGKFEENGAQCCAAFAKAKG